MSDPSLRRPASLYEDSELVLARILDESGSGAQLSQLFQCTDSRFSNQQMAEFEQAQQCLEILAEAVPGFDASYAETAALNFDAATESDVEVEEESPMETFPLGLPRRIAHFKVNRLIGSGGFGIVLQARDELLGRDVALKIPKMETLLSAESRRRFEREAKAAGSLSHPAIVPVFETGRFGPTNYIASGFVDGPTLDRWLGEASEVVDSAMAAAMVARLADALGHAHQRGVIHRDIKPGNILIDGNLEPGSDQLVDSLRITDFGLAALSSDPQSLTVDGALVGTPAYMAPEHASGGNDSGPAGDIYGLGVVLFQLLTGKLPFSGSTNLAIIKAVSESPAPSPRILNREVQHDLAAICLKCLEKKPRDRYSSASDLSDDLYRFLNQQPIRARRPSALRRAGMLARRHPIAVVLSVMLLASLLIGLLGTWYQFQNAQQNRRFAESNFHQARETVDRLFEKAMSVELETQPTVQKEMLTTVAEFYRQFIKQEYDDPALNYDLAVASRNLGKIEREFGRQQEALAELTRAKNLFKKTVTSDSPAVWQLEALGSLIDFALQYDLLGQLEKAANAGDTAIEFGQGIVDRFPESPEIRLEFSRAVKNKAAVLRQMREYSEAKQLFDQCLELRQELAGQFPDETKYLYRVALVHSSLADWHVSQNEQEPARDHADRYLNIIRKLLAGEPSSLTYQLQLPAAMNRVSDVLRNFRNEPDWHDQAIGLLDAAEQLQRTTLDQYPLLSHLRRSLVNTVANQGDVFRIIDRPRNAIAKYADASELAEKGLVEATDTDFKLQFSRLRVLRLKGSQLEIVNELEQALECYSQAIAECESLVGTGERPYLNSEFQKLLKVRGKLLLKLDQVSAAQKDLKKYRSIGGKDWDF